MRKIFSTLARYFGLTGPATFAQELKRTEPQPRLMLRELGDGRYGIGLLYVPAAGLFYVHGNGATHSLTDAERCTDENGVITCPTYWPSPNEQQPLTELPSTAFKVETNGDMRQVVLL